MLRAVGSALPGVFDPRWHQKGGVSAGFTLIELLVVVAIIGILAAVVQPALSIMNNKSKNGVRWGSRFVSILLIAGGILGIMLAFSLIKNFSHQHQPYRLIVPVASIAVFGWGAFKGISLWRGKPSGYKWAKILFALQIPVLTLGRWSYEFSTAMSARIMFGHTNRQFGGDIGSSLNFLISPDPLGWLFGINLIAVMVLVYLFWASPPNEKKALTKTR